MNKKWLGVSAIIPAMAMSFMDQSILPVALPAIQQELGASNIALQWCVNAYLLTTAVFVLIGGKLSDRIGHRRAFLLGILLFAFSSALCGISSTAGFLIGARALQGVGSALMFPAQTAFVAALFPHNQRGRATGLMVSIGSLFLILGPLIGGYLTESFSWHWIFWINLPIAAIGFCLTLAFLPSPKPGIGKIDFAGFVFFALWASATTTLFMQAPEWGWISSWSQICIALAIVSLVLLLRRERKATHPFLDLALFKRPVFAAINISISITQFIIMITVFRTIYFEEILGYTPTQTGLLISATSFPILFFSPIGGYLSDKVSPKLPIALGYLLIIFSFFWLAFFSTPSLPSLFTSLISFAMGVPLIFTPSYSSSMSVVPPTKLGVAFGMVATLRMLAGTLGLALINLFVDTVQKNRLPTDGKRLAEIASFSAVHFALGLLLLVAFAAAFVFHTRKSAHHLPESPAEGWD